MRELTKKQKTLLIKWYKNSNDNLTCFDNLESEQIEELEQINNTEVLVQNVNRLLDDLRNN